MLRAASRTRCDGATARRVAHPLRRRDSAASHVPAATARQRGESRSTHAQRGVALVITLVLLSIITFMAITFLVVSRSQHGAVVVETDNATARLATDTASQRAMAELSASILAGNNEFNYGLLVSTNYINPAGFTSGGSSPLNVSYNYPNGTPLNLNDSLTNIANLLYNPRPPVFITTNRNQLTPPEFRYYLDLNRNGRAEPSGLQPVINPQGGFYDLKGNPIPQPLPGNTLSNFDIGDPEWIGNLQRPEFRHSAANRFISRSAVLVVPASQTLDLNTIYNQAKPVKSNRPGSDGFLRNQGVLTAELNLAALLVDLNTNLWPLSAPNQYGFGYYTYNPDVNGPSTGAAADDAQALVRYRYAGNRNTLASVSALFPGNGINAYSGAIAFNNAPIDAYSEGPVMTGTSWPLPANFYTRVNSSWSGAENPNHFYTTQELFDKTKTAIGLSAKAYSFTDRLLMAGTNTDSYNRYTFYRLLSVLGTDSPPEPGSKMNLNYCNVDNYGYVVPNMATNFIPWTPVQFFTNAAIRLLADAGYTAGNPNGATNLLVTNLVGGILVTNLQIPLWPNNFYTPSVHRLFQLAANLYDAARAATNGLPSVFRPIFFKPPAGKGGSGVFISDFQEVTDRSVLLAPPRDLQLATDRAGLRPTDMIYGHPLVIGAKKGLPNFNEFAMQTRVQVTRKLQFSRKNSGQAGTDMHKDFDLNQMFVIGISNAFGLEAWNSYSTPYPRNLQMVVIPDLSVSVTITNKSSPSGPTTRSYLYQPAPIAKSIPANTWPGYAAWQEQYSFITPLTNGSRPFMSHLFLTNSTYSGVLNDFMPLTGQFDSATKNRFYVPEFWINLKTRLRFALIDTDANRIVDYVNLVETNTFNTASALATGGQCGDSYTPDGSSGSMWCTNRMSQPANDTAWTFGINNQIEAGLGHTTADWNSSGSEFPAGMDKNAAINFFRTQFGMGLLAGTKGSFYLSNTFNAPFQPFRDFYLVTSWQANDPLVHYTIGDLSDVTRTNLVLDKLNPPPTDNLGRVNARYEPWGGNPSGRSSSSTPLCELTVKDPLMLQSDYWDFPTNKLPNAAWLGRVHRGTPWQTVYLKSPSLGITLTNWQKWTGNGQIVTNVGQLATNLVPLYVPGTFLGLAGDAYFAQPTNDWRLLDLFTTALNDSATRGQLSVNQANLAAWSALLSGVIVLTNNLDAGGVLDPLAIQPAGVYNPFDASTWPPLVRIVNGINNARVAINPRHVFSRLSDILAVPELTVASPFLNTNGTPTRANSGLNDTAYERLPQQIAGLLKVDPVPRFVIYAFGQTLKPESNRAIVKSGPFAGLCTNYQIVAEAATRTVVRFEGVPPNRGNNPPAITTLHPVIESFNVLPTD